MENDSNNNEVKDDVFVNSNPDNGFQKVKTTDKKKKAVNSYYSGKPKSGFIKSIFVPFVSGIVGASLVLGICLYVPAVNEKVFNKSTSEDNKSTVINYQTGKVSNTVNLSDYSNTAISVANKVLPSVVSIEIEYTVSSPSFYGRGTNTSTSVASGSGVIITSDGYILTNNHVVSEDSSSSYYQVSTANKITVHLYNDDTDYEAQIVGTDDVTDLAVLKIDATNLTAAELGDSSQLSVGEFVMAVGNPLDMNNSVTAGIVSALNRELSDENDITYNLIQTDAAINAGNSGGALVNADGKVIGINTLKLYGTSVEGMGFAIPINDTLDIIDQLITYNKVKRPYIGISGSDISEEYSKYYDLPQGVYVNSVEKDGPAEAAGLKTGDIITKLNDTEIKSMTELTKAKNECEIGDTVSVTIYRNGKSQTLTLTLGETP